MGVIISRFQHKETTIEKLEKLEKKIKRIEQDGQYTELKHKKVICSIMVYSVGLYVLAFLYYYLYVGRTQYWLHSAMYASPLFVIPILVILLRFSITRYYTWSLRKQKSELNRMKTDKKRILEDVMNTEKYKVAKEILDKYGSPDDQKPIKSLALKMPGNPCIPTPGTPVQSRQRQLAIQSPTPINHSLVPLSSTPNVYYKGPRLRSDQLPRPLLDKNRSALDKVVDYLLKDGPNHRMALICSQCSSHNGMSLEEEFEFVSYVCAYCGYANPARRQRPAAPPLPAASPRAILPPPTSPGGGDDSSVASSKSDSEDEENNPRSGGSEGEPDRTPSPVEEAPKSEEEKKQD